ncbi:hypothetical protein Acr_24g0001430 [Actinidia rufa]|uniref:Bet v I/Major latex protein domain-containing protein n=1 Tax=Actinidia rufa TaxID=165716 RepID=A0A7J0GT43_9ERIC|nr:hypothetical protein Acr_24g0001430 [Actinidia rufa]
MGAITYDMEIPSSISAEKMFKAFVLDGDTIIPKALPHAITCVQNPRRRWRCWNHQTYHFWRGVHKSVKHRIDGLDKENFTYSYSIIEGGALDVFESISYHIKIVATPDGGCICKNRSIYTPKCDAQVSEEEIKAGKEKASGIFKKVEAYLLANPDC